MKFKGLTTFDFILKYREAKIYSEEEFYAKRKNKGRKKYISSRSEAISTLALPVEICKSSEIETGRDENPATGRGEMPDLDIKL